MTGGDSGIGSAAAVLYAREGADVAIVYLPQEQADADETRRAVEAEQRRCVLIAGDITQPEFAKQAVERTVQELGHLDILVNNAAFQQHQASLDDVSEEQRPRRARSTRLRSRWPRASRKRGFGSTASRPARSGRR